MSELTRRSLMAAGAAAFTMPALAPSAFAQAAWPTRPVRIVVPYPAGGQTDGIGRAFGDYLTRQLGQPFVVENKAGGGGVLGVTEVKRAPADGYTILCTISSSLIQNRASVKDLPYDPEKDFIYLGSTTGSGGPLVMSARTGVTNLKEFLDYARKVDKINFGAYGVGSTPHMVIGTLAKQYGFKYEAIQYRGEAPMFADVAAGTLDGAYGSYAAASPVIDSGRGKLIAVVGSRLPTHPNVPTITEQGASGGFYETRPFTAFAVPAGTPKEIVDRLAGLIAKGGEDTRVNAMLTSFLLNPPHDMAETNRRFRSDTAIILDLMKELGVKPE